MKTKLKNRKGSLGWLFEGIAAGTIKLCTGLLADQLDPSYEVLWIEINGRDVEEKGTRVSLTEFDPSLNFFVVIPDLEIALNEVHVPVRFSKYVLNTLTRLSIEWCGEANKRLVRRK